MRTTLSALWNTYAAFLSFACVEALGGATPSWWLAINALLWPVISLLSTALRQSGHALCGHLVGLRVRRIMVGSGAALARFTLGDVPIRVGRMPSYGATSITVGSSSRLVEVRLWIAIAAGPLVAAGLMLFALEFSRGSLISRLAIAEMFALANGVTFILSILPLRNDGVPTVGRRLLTLPFEKNVARDLKQAALRHDLWDALDHHDYDRAQSVAAQMLSESPADVNLQLVPAYVEMERGDYSAARRSYEALLTTAGGAALDVVKNNLAWITFMQRDVSRLEEADRLSAEVLAVEKQPYAFGTRGAILLWKGELEEACRLLEAAYSSTVEDRNAALNASCLAMAWAGRGDRNRATSWLKRARSADPKCALLPEAVAAVAQRSP